MRPRPAFRFDLNRCTGCQACMLACGIENALPLGASWRRVEDFNPQGLTHAPRFHLSLACNHCGESPCATACPADAYRRDPGTGALLLDEESCIGCRYCSWACPFDAPRFEADTGTMGKCTLCSPRLAAGREPACVAICPTGALGSGELDALSAAGAVGVVPGFPASPADPALRFVPLRAGAGGGEPPEGVDGTGCAGGEPPDGEGRRLRLRDEWPLLVFTWAAPLLVALKLDTMPICRLDRPWPILVGGLIAMALSAAHLGRPLRAWRALLGVRHSWLSREIAAFGAFVLLAGALPLLLPPTLPLPLSLAAGFTGLFALHAMDRVYDVALPRRGLAGLHSAEATLTALLYALALRGWGWALLAALALKLMLWGARYRGAERLRLDPAGGLRLALGLAAGAALLGGAHAAAPWLLALLAAGEFCDRLAYYRELRFPSPGRDLAQALAAWPASEPAAKP